MNLDNEEDDPFTKDFIECLTRPISPYAIQRVEQQVGTVFWHPITSAKIEMLEEWWLENEPELTPDARGRCARKRLRRHQPVVE